MDEPTRYHLKADYVQPDESGSWSAYGLMRSKDGILLIQREIGWRCFFGGTELADVRR